MRSRAAYLRMRQQEWNYAMDRRSLRTCAERHILTVICTEISRYTYAANENNINPSKSKQIEKIIVPLYNYTSIWIPDTNSFRSKMIRTWYLNSKKVKVKWGKPSGEFQAITLQQCQKETNNIMPLLDCWSGTVTRGCRCYDVTFNSLYILKTRDGLWLTFTAWDRHNPNPLMDFTYKMPGVLVSL